MISICIPIYNHDVRPLVRQLRSQADELDCDMEIVAIDDCSSPSFRSLNGEVATFCDKYVELHSNVGRAVVRNRLAELASRPYLLFLDCDGLPGDSHFLRRYRDSVADGKAEVVCGGRLHRGSLSASNNLRYLYAMAGEYRPIDERRRHPESCMMTCNFVVRRSLLLSVPFDERLVTYGHEDTLWGFRLSQRGVQVFHIDNPVVCSEWDDNATFLDKTDQAVANLAAIYLWLQCDARFAGQVRLLSAYSTLRRYRLIGVLRLVGEVACKPMRRLLVKGRGGVRMLNIYKLCRLAHEMRVCSRSVASRYTQTPLVSSCPSDTKQSFVMNDSSISNAIGPNGSPRQPQAAASASHRYARPYTPFNVRQLNEGEIFVFGSNIRGMHGGGAAFLAAKHFGAEYGVGEGLTGRCYALPTMEGGVDYIGGKVQNFLACARQHPELTFLVTQVACGIAGFRPEEIAPLFRDALPMQNVLLPRRFVEILEKAE